jgi:hypothetical protein
MSVAQISRQGTVRHFGQGDIEQVADLSWRMLNQETGPAPSRLRYYFEELYFHNPWREDSLPSLVCEDAKGKLVGFLGVIPRRMMLGERVVRVACGSTLVVEPAKRSTLAGLCLMQAFLAGNQDLSLGDSANDIARRVWTGLGGSTGLLHSLSWSHPLRPAAYGLRMVSRLKANKPPKLLVMAAKPICKLADYAAARIPGPFKNSDCGLLAEELEPLTLLDCLSTFSDGQPLRGQYDLASLVWLLGFMGTARGHGDLRKRLLRDAEGSVIGWYVYFVKRGGIAEVAQIGARRKAMGQVLDHLFWDAWKHGALAVHGQLDPTHAEDLREKCCFFYRRGSWLLVHSRDRELQQYILSGNAFLSRLDGEWCMGFPLNEN